MKKGEIKYKKWIDKGSAVSLETFSDNSDKFISQLFEDIDDLNLHHFVADTHKAYLSFCKNNLKYDTCIIEMDFSENYSFVIQESVQAFYFDNLQVTIHPFCLYLKKIQMKYLM